MPSPQTPEEREPERDAILARLERLHPRIIDLSLGRIHRLLAAMGNPERRLPPVVHVAGTNGKGSTIAFMRAVLEAAGERVHVYTSPHLVTFNERIRLAGEIIDDQHLREVLQATERANKDEPITFFEVTTAAAFLAFAETPADVLLLETGLGGRLDATNVIDKPLLTVITPVSIDHQHYLGTELAGIAAEKAGILKPGVECILGPQPNAAAIAIDERATEVAAPLYRYGTDWSVVGVQDGLCFTSDLGARQLPLPNLFGKHQIENAGLAVASLERLPGIALPSDAYAVGLRSADWPARMQRLTSGPLCELAPPRAEIWLDGGHNPDASKALAETLTAWDADRTAPPPFYLVFGMLDNRDPETYLAPLALLHPTVISVPVPGNHSGLSADACRQAADRLGIKAEAAASPEEALAWICRHAVIDAPPRILICGSLYLAGAVLADNA